ncbi:uncharacterized protein LACBIDRAFT_322087 [Laccaria bicolor S238N-H82]|uniref:Predicted protein n=1 Tax=Laccaria bicolor (strain S238N-H82 / ATCC MYA-4686) TaxID=486041 RepID=B0CS29_LACBS|nr:uncharacterized protein LACBIDRAFT_322087 [Laccaria bicolor S238N-H82]EDR14225.1 predicted protein [Laccaria bicolor S238N-H82]|eukprot:XP_001874784.1 predicted protein [Laccaria bicolor S238N-H82]
MFENTRKILHVLNHLLFSLLFCGSLRIDLESTTLLQRRMQLRLPRFQKEACGYRRSGSRYTNRLITEETSHALITIDPKVDDAGLLDRAEYDGQIATPYILNLLVISKNREFANGMKDTFRTFMLNPFTRSAAGVIFEGRGHLYLFSSLKSPLIIQPLSMDEKPVSVKLQHAERIHFFKDLPTSFNNLNVNLYYQPLSPTTLGIDSFCLEVDDNGVATSVVFFQFTISENHPINPSFVSKLWKKGTRVRNQPKWKLVFIVPLEDVPTFRTQIWKSDGDIWSRRVSHLLCEVGE